MGLAFKASGRTTRMAGLVGVLIAIAACVPAANAATVKNKDLVPPVSKVSSSKKGPAGVVTEEIAQPASASDWTRAEMMSAKPVGYTAPEASLDLEPFEAAAGISINEGDFTPGNVTAYPQRIHGKIFFKVGNDVFTCSGTVVNSAQRNVIFTAGHCVFDRTANAFVTDLIFVPGYENGNAPLDIYGAESLLTTNAWVNNGSNSYDIAIVRLAQKIENLVVERNGKREPFGSRRIAFDLEKVLDRPMEGLSGRAAGLPVTIFGYPSRPNPPFNGEVLRGCHSSIVVRDTNKARPFPIGGAPCSMMQGSSGGGWMFLGGYLSSVVSYGYCDQVPDLCGLTFGPYFSDAAKSLYTDPSVGGSPAPTVKLQKAPPKVVRKRKVNFRFAGSAATLIGFSCKLDGKRARPCSSRISITRLRPGKHTLRVWAVDQTGKTSKKPVVRKFRVVLKKKRR